MKYQVTVFSNEIKCLSYIMAKKDLRHYLNGIHINAKAARLEATNGIAAMRLDISELVHDLGDGVENVVLPIEVVDYIVKNYKKHGTEILLQIDAEEGTVKIDMVTLPLMDMRGYQYPDLKRVYPAENEEFTREIKDLGFNTANITDYGKAINALNKAKFTIFAPDMFSTASGRQCAYCKVNNAEYLLMLCRK